MECISEKNKVFCNCTYEQCPRKFKCCECMHYHRKNSELPACFFSKNAEKTYDRSIRHFITLQTG